MNASQLYSGEYYAYHPYPPRGRIPVDAIKVMLRHTEQRKRSYDKNRHTVAAITLVESGREISVPARQLIMFWDDYEAEQQHMLEEKAERERLQMRRNLRREILQSIINTHLAERNIPLTVTLDWREVTAYVNVSGLLEWLGITEAVINEAIDYEMERH